MTAMATPTTSATPSPFTLTLSPFTPAGSIASISASSNSSSISSSSSAYTDPYSPTGVPPWECAYDADHSNGDLRLPLALLYSLFFLLGLVGNALALWVFLFLQTRRRGGVATGGGAAPRHNSVRVLLINCVAADLVLLACLPFRIYYHLNGNVWGLGSVACRLVGNLFYMNMYISITLLGLIGLDRCLRLGGRGTGAASSSCSTRGRDGARRRRRSQVVCGVIWALSLATLVPMVAATEGNEKAGRCFQYKQRRTAPGKAYFNLALVLMFWCVFAALAVSYGRIAARLLRVQRDRGAGLPGGGRYGRTARKSFVVLAVFAVCFGPYHAFRPVYVASQLAPARWCGRAAAVDRTNEIMLLLSAFNACLDPVMYFLLSGSVRKSAARVLAGKGRYFLSEATSGSEAAAAGGEAARRRSSVAAVAAHAVGGGMGGAAAAAAVGGGGGAGPARMPLEDLSATSTTGAGGCPWDSRPPAEP